MKDLVIQHSRTQGLFMDWRHLHSQYEILFVKEGQVVIDSNASTFTVTTPCIIVHKPFYLHRANAPENAVYDRYIINISEELLSKVSGLIPGFAFFSSATTTPITLDDEMCERLTEEFDKILCAYQENNESRALLNIALLLLDIAEYATEKGVPLPANDSYISKVIHYISEHYADDIKIDRIADYFYISRSKLISDFKKSIGVTIKKYIMFVKISNAQCFLTAGKTISETAALCGFYDNSHFISTFRLLTGMTPKDFVKKRIN